MAKKRNNKIKNKVKVAAMSVNDDANEFASQRLRERRIGWEWNRRLLGIALIVVTIGLVVGFIAYRLNRAAAVTTFLVKAEEAEKESDYLQQAKWLKRCMLLQPEEVDLAIQAAFAADKSVDVGSRKNKPARVDQARRYLGFALAKIDSDHKDYETLRRMLIPRLLQIGGGWYAEAERLVIGLDAAAGEPQATKWLAKSLVGRVRQGYFSERITNNNEAEYWELLSQQLPGDVLIKAVEVNPQDIDLLAELQRLAQDSPELFSLGAEKRRFHDQIGLLLSPLSTLDSSRAQSIWWNFQDSIGNGDAAMGKLLASSDQALERLKAKIREWEDSGSTSEFEELDDEVYTDFYLVSRSAIETSKSSPDEARRRFALLQDIPPEMITVSILETAFQQAGRFEISQGNFQNALKVFERGLERCGSENMQLLGATVSLCVELELAGTESSAGIALSQETLDFIDRYKASIKAAANKNLLTSEQKSTRVNRSEIARNIAVHRWRIKRIDAISSLQRGEVGTAIDLFEDALADDADVETIERFTVIQGLARLYREQGMWDSAAFTLERGLDLAPSSTTVKLAAAEAWEIAGNFSKSMELWESLSHENSILLRSRALEARFEHVLRLPDTQHDFSGIRSSLKQLQGVTNDGSSEAVVAAKILERLEVQLPRPGDTLQQHLDSALRLEEVERLAAKYPNDRATQFFAAQQLFNQGELKRVEQLIARLAEASDEGKQLAAELRVGFKSSRASESPSSEEPETGPATVSKDGNSAPLYATAANVALKRGDLKAAFEAYTAIPENRQSLRSLFVICRIAGELSSEQLPASFAATNEPQAALVAHWRKLLKEREGDNGSFGMLLDVEQRYKELVKVEGLDVEDSRLVEMRNMATALVAKRPRWCEAIAALGLVESLRRNHRGAALEFDRAIAAGDRRASTVRLMLQELMRSGQWTEADKQLQVAQKKLGIDLDPRGIHQMRIARGQGDFQQLLAVTRKQAANNPDDFELNFLHATVAVQMAKDAKQAERKSSLDEATLALRKAEAAAEEEDRKVLLDKWLLVAILQRDKDLINRIVERVKNSNLPEIDRVTLAGRGLIAMGDLAAALKEIIRADQLKPSSRSMEALAELYRLLDMPDQRIDALKTALRRKPQNTELRNRLASAILTQDGSAADWDELKELFRGEGADDSNRLFYAVSLISTDEQAKRKEGKRILHELVDEQNDFSKDSKRILANVTQLEFEATATSDIDKRARLDLQFRGLCNSLTEMRSPEASDLRRYASYLLKHGQNADLGKVGRILETLKRNSRGSLETLEIELRHAVKTEHKSDAPRIVARWVDSAKQENILSPSRIAMVAGLALSDLGFVEDGIGMVEQGYQKNPAMLGNLVLLLIKNKRFEKSIDVCSDRYAQVPDVNAAVLMVESMLGISHEPVLKSLKYNQQIDDAVSKNPNNIALLEAVATLRMQQENYTKALVLYRKIDQLNPNRIRTLNNLAMACAETGGMAEQGIKPIQRAIELAGRVPELLDTYAAVLLKAGRLEEAIEVLDEAISKTVEPRYQFHKVQVLRAQGKDPEAKKLWRTMDIKSIDFKSLTPKEILELKQIKLDFGASNE